LIQLDTIQFKNIAATREFTVTLMYYPDFFFHISSVVHGNDEYNTFPNSDSIELHGFASIYMTGLTFENRFNQILSKLESIDNFTKNKFDSEFFSLFKK